MVQLKDEAASIPLSIKVLFAITAILAIVGGLAAAHILRQGAPLVQPAHIGETVEVPGGILRVEQVIPEQMAPMQMQQPGQPGMPASGMGMDMAPAGQRRFTVAISLSAKEPSGLRLAQHDFQVSGDGVTALEPLRAALGEGIIPQGSQSSTWLTFEAPETARRLLLNVRGGERPIALVLPEAGEHHSGGDTGSDERQHDDPHEHGGQDDANHEH